MNEKCAMLLVVVSNRAADKSFPTSLTVSVRVREVEFSRITLIRNLDFLLVPSPKIPP